MPNIKLLKYDDNNLTHKGLSEIFAIEGLKSLQILSVQRNKIVATERFVRDNKDQRIQGPHNDMKDAQSWEKTMSLQILDLSGNKKFSVKNGGRSILQNCRNFLRTTILICDECKIVQDEASEQQDKIDYNILGNDLDLIRPAGEMKNALILTNLSEKQKYLFSDIDF